MQHQNYTQVSFFFSLLSCLCPIFSLSYLLSSLYLFNINILTIQVQNNSFTLLLGLQVIYSSPKARNLYLKSYYYYIYLANSLRGFKQYPINLLGHLIIILKYIYYLNNLLQCLRGLKLQCINYIKRVLCQQQLQRSNNLI